MVWRHGEHLSQQEDPIEVPWRGKRLLVYWDRIRCVQFDCDPRKFCTPSGSCCREYEVTVGPKERSIIDGLLPLAAKYVPELRDSDGYHDPFEPVENGLSALEQNERGYCIFSYRCSGALFCALHRAASDAGMDPAHAKPRACTLWPLALGPNNGCMALSPDPNAESFPCVHLRRDPAPQPCPAILHIIRSLFGKTLLNRLLRIR